MVLRRARNTNMPVRFRPPALFNRILQSWDINGSITHTTVGVGGIVHLKLQHNLIGDSIWLQQQ